MKLKSIFKNRNSKLIRFVPITLIYLYSSWVLAAEEGISKSSSVLSDNIEKRIAGFQKHNKERVEYEKEKNLHLSEFLKSKKEQQKSKDKVINEYKLEKAKQKKVDPESTPDYQEYLLKKWSWRNNPEKQKDKDLLIKSKLSHQNKIKSKKFEVEEFGLNNSEENRVPFNKRNLFVTKTNDKGGSSSSGGSFSGSDYGGGGGGGSPYTPPPPSFDNDLPEFEENNIPPPPPPPIDFGPENFGGPGGGEPMPYMPPPQMPGNGF